MSLTSKCTTGIQLHFDRQNATKETLLGNINQITTTANGPKVKVFTDIAVRQSTSPLREITCHGITQCYLPPGSGNFPAFTPAEASTQFSDAGGMQD